MPSFGPQTYGESFADVYNEWYGQVTDADATADFVTRRAEAGPILELGVGTGRLAVPLLERGHDVVGLDASSSMLSQCPTSVDRVLGDMASLPFEPGPHFGGALCAFNTFFNLPSASLQQQALTQVSSRLLPNAPLIIEGFTGIDFGEKDDSSLGVSTIDADKLVLSATKTDRNAQTITGQHVDIRESGITMRPWLIRWCTPSQLDEMATSAGLRLHERYSSWNQELFTSKSELAISVYLR